ncbi:MULTISPECIES: DUF1896 family protein [Muribaculaceae]|jgi:hypothetical protein|uniref:DUF1896 family protein n=1 Tax=Muribaculaceae TaxID=2005473 RepID=UPI002625ABB2|nr:MULTISPECIES: DUF1896 family protein [Muribaculaceae]
MKQNVESREMDGYRVYLQGHLRDHHFPQRNNRKFIEQRVEDAYDRFITLRLDGRSVPYAEEMAMRTLLDGLYVSRYDIIYNVVEENSSLGMRLPEEYWPDFAVHLLGLQPVREILDRYEVNGDFMSRETYQPMLIELLGIISEILDGYEL